MFLSSCCYPPKESDWLVFVVISLSGKKQQVNGAASAISKGCREQRNGTTDNLLWHSRVPGGNQFSPTTGERFRVKESIYPTQLRLQKNKAVLSKSLADCSGQEKWGVTNPLAAFPWLFESTDLFLKGLLQAVLWQVSLSAVPVGFHIVPI